MNNNTPPRKNHEDNSIHEDDEGSQQYQYYDAISPLETVFNNSTEDSLSRPSSTRHHKHVTLRKRVQRVGRVAALTTKQAVWDSNDASIHAALSAVDQWEGGYNAFRALLLSGLGSIRGLYSAAKEGAGRLEHGFLMPVRDWILLPAFFGAEQGVMAVTSFVQSDQARLLACQTLEWARAIPYVGDTVLAPSLQVTGVFVQNSWAVLQYPIPSKQQVRDTVNVVLNGSKCALTVAGREILFYVKRADANITRTLSTTRWKVLGSGPYETLERTIKGDVLNHMCERYLSLSDPVARYELAAHVRTHNAPLYNDLVNTGILQERGGALTADDEWLSVEPAYRRHRTPLLMEDEVKEAGSTVSLWFFQPRSNGEVPARDAPWVWFRNWREQQDLECKFRALASNMGADAAAGPGGSVLSSNSSLSGSSTCSLGDESSSTWDPNKFPTISHWYEPDVTSDVLVDQKRHAVSFGWCCANCRQELPVQHPPMAPYSVGAVCDECADVVVQASNLVSTFTAVPALAMIRRPTLWRFYGSGDDVRRSTWFLDTPRQGLQPFNLEDEAILEDAYMYLRSLPRSRPQRFVDEAETGANSDEDVLDNVLLTVEVNSPAGNTILVQFSSLSYATAIQKGLQTSFAMFKRRVYRGAWLDREDPEESVLPVEPHIEEIIREAAAEYGVLGDTIVPDMSLRALLVPAVPEKKVSAAKLNEMMELAVPSPRLAELDMDMCMLSAESEQQEDAKTEEVDHLVLVVHGIGEMMRAIDVFGLVPHLGTIIDCCGYLRKNQNAVQDSLIELKDAAGCMGRVEFLPVEWHEALTIMSQRRSRREHTNERDDSIMLGDISLKTIPQMRDFANDTLMDVLYFMSPQYHDAIVEVVVSELNLLIRKYRKLTGFRGGVSIVGHSLGSIISWDILSNQVDVGDTTNDQQSVSSPQASHDGSMSPSYPQLSFSVDNFFLLGSPVPVFLMIRNQQEPLHEDFSLKGCKCVFNVFHPYDPVAYRIEPCIDRRNAEFEPIIISHWNGGYRVQYQTKRLWKKIVAATWETQQSFVEVFEASVAGLGLLKSSDSKTASDEELSSEVSSEMSFCQRQVSSGQLNQGHRIDFMLQEKEIESANEYVAALAAHSSYWVEKDLSLFIARQIYTGESEKRRAEALR